MTLLEAVLDTLIPGAATRPGLAADVAPDDALLAALPADFPQHDAGTRETLLRALEATHPAAFERLVAATYIAYYTHPETRAALERETGYEARPPQPLGYELPPFDDALLDTQRRRAPFWRRP